MRIPILWAVGAALVGVLAVFAVGQAVLNPPLPLIISAGFDAPSISPNADGVNDLTTFRYALARNARVSLTLTAEDGQVYAFRQNEPRLLGEYSVLFSGVVDGFLKPDEVVSGVVERRLLEDGVYTWELLAENDGERASVTGTLTLEGADATLPTMSAFTVAPEVFTPNQDGVDDRVEINVYLDKPSNLTVFLIDANGRQLPISARKEGRKAGEAGRHIFDYEGGIDLGADPPKDGTYTIVALAQDAVGQRVRQEARLTIRNGGKPRAEIVPQAVGVDVAFLVRPYEERYLSTFDALGELIDMPNEPASLSRNPITMRVGDLLVFKLTVENYNNVPIRTSFPPPGTVYQQDQMAASLGAFQESGAWRVGIQCETSTTSFPYRWAIGSASDLISETDPRTGITYYYLPAGARAVVWGAVRMTSIEKRQNPQNCWAGLIHEDVEVSLRNSYVGARQIFLVDPTATNDGG
jgi:hypothetical protein